MTDNKSNTDAKAIMTKIEAEHTPEELAKKWAPRGTNTQGLTLEKLQGFMPKNSTVKLTEEILEIVNRAEEDTGMDQGLFEEQLCSYSHLIGPGISFEKLMNAIKFVTLREVARGNARAYKIVFPVKSAEIEARGETVDSFASMYAQTKAVIEVQKLNMVGVHITHRPLANQLLKKMVDLSNGIGAKPDDYVSPTVQLNATVAAYEAVKPPEDNTMELKIGMSDQAISVQENLANQISQMAEIQMKRFASGDKIGDIQKLKINVEPVIDVDVEI